MEHLEIVTPPAIEPLTLQEAKDHLRVAFSDDDGMIAAWITAARMRAETILRQTLISTTYDWSMDGFPASANGYFNRLVRQMGPSPQWLPNGAAILFLPKPPLISVTSLKYYDSTGNLTTFDLTKAFVSTGFGARIQPLIGNVWPVLRPQIDGVTVRYVAGYGTTEASVPVNITAGMKLLIGHWYEHREAVADVQTYPVPDAVDALLSASDHGSYA